MNYGFYISASGLRVQEARMDVLANNMANVNTTSFKPDHTVVRQRQPAFETTNLPPNLIVPVLDDVQGGLKPGGTHTNFTQGPLQRTGQELDLALQGRGFFQVEVDGQMRYTRDGRFAIDNQGYLVTAAEGHRVLDAGGVPIQLPPGRARIDERGIIQVGEFRANLGMVDFEEPAALVKEGRNVYSADNASPVAPADARVLQGYIEGSGVEGTRALVEMISAQRAYDASARMMQFTNDMLGRAVNDIARFA